MEMTDYRHEWLKSEDKVHELEDALATAREETVEAVKFAMTSTRAVAMEEAARLARDWLAKMGFVAVGNGVSEAIRGRAPLPPHLQILSIETVEQVRVALAPCQSHGCLPCCPTRVGVAATRAAVSAKVVVSFDVPPLDSGTINPELVMTFANC